MESKIKVLHIIKSLGRGGAEMLLPETLALHNQLNFEFHYIYFLPWKDQLVEAIEIAGGRVTCFKAKNNIAILSKYKSIINYVKAEDIDLIHCHLPWAGFVGRIVFRKLKIPVVYTEHNKQERYHPLTFLLNKLTFNKQSRVIAVSEDVKNSIVSNINPVIPVETVLNGVNTDKFIPKKEEFIIRNELGIPHDAIVVGTVAVFRFQKRLKEWLEVMEQVTQESPKFYGIIVGDGPLKEEIVAEHARLMLKGRVFLVGLKTDVLPWLRTFDIYMMTSVFEGLPIALLEAMSTGCAVVSTNAGGIKEVIEDEGHGKLVEIDAYSELKDELLSLEDKSQMKMLGLNARERVVQYFSLNTMVEQLEKLYLNEIRNSTWK